MNVLFVYSLNDIETPSKPLDTPEMMQFGISYISALLKKHGHQTRLLVLSRVSGDRNREIIDECLKSFRPELIGFTSISSEYPFIADVAKYLKGSYPGYLVIGGPEASLNPERVISGDFDALCVGEGEYPVLELVSQLENGTAPSGIPNLWIKHGSEIEKNAPRPFLEDLDSLPFPDRDMWQEWINEQPGAKLSVLLGRGCPFQCSYCCNHAFRRLAPGGYVRLRRPDDILQEIAQISVTFPTKKEVYLEVETFGTNKKWAMELCSLLEGFNATLPEPLSFGVNLRVTPKADLESLFVACQKANFRFINIGLESGSERIRREILRRNYSNEDIISAVALARKYGLKVCFFNMMGLPTETPADFAETVRVNRTCLPDWHSTYIFFPYPGTDLYALCQERGLLSSPLTTKRERMEATLDLPEFGRKQIKRNFVWFDYYVYKGHKPTYKLLARVLKAELKSNPHLNGVLKRVSRLFFFQLLRKLLR